MSVVTIDAKGLKCPIPVLKIVALAPKMNQGDILEVFGDCPTFEDDVRKWCEREKKALLAVNSHGDALKMQIQF